MQGRIVGKVKRVNGPVLTASGITDAQMMELVHVSDLGIVGEIVKLREGEATIQVYEDATGIKPGDNIYGSGMSLSAELAPGLIGNIYDGIQRPLEELKKLSGDFIGKGIAASAVDHDKLWHFVPSVSVGDKLHKGSIIGSVQETERVVHRVMIPPTVEGELVVSSIVAEGDYRVRDELALVISDKGKKTSVSMLQYWPIRRPRPVADHAVTFDAAGHVQSRQYRSFRSGVRSLYTFYKSDQTVSGFADAPGYQGHSGRKTLCSARYRSPHAQYPGSGFDTQADVAGKGRKDPKNQCRRSHLGSAWSALFRQ